MTPQTMSMITRVFPPQKRGAAMGLWGAVAGVATITGPVLGGLLVQTVGWEWIFYVNIPVGVVALVARGADLPTLPTANRSFDGLGVLLSVVGMFLRRVRPPGGRDLRLGHHHRPDHGLGRHRRGRRSCSSASCSGSATSGSDALLPLTPVPPPQLLAVQRGRRRRDLRDDRHLLPVHALPAGGARPRARCTPRSSACPARCCPASSRRSPAGCRTRSPASGSSPAGSPSSSVAITWLALAVAAGRAGVAPRPADDPVRHRHRRALLAAGQPGHLGSRRPHRRRRRGCVQHDPADRRRHRVGRGRRHADLAPRGRPSRPRRRTRPASCPRQLRQPFVDGVRRRAASPAARPRSCPSSVPGRRRRADPGTVAPQAVHSGFATAVDADDAAHGRRAGRSGSSPASR